MSYSADKLFKAMADSTRQRLLQALLQHELNVSELVEVLGQPQSTISRHLKILREAGLITERREGTTVLHHARTENAGGNGDSLTGHILAWTREQPMAEWMRDRLAKALQKRQSQSREFFERVADRWDQMRVDCFGDRFHLEALLSLMPGDLTVADVGAGTGFLLPVLAAHFREVIAVEPVPEMLAAAQARPELAGLERVCYRQGDLSRLPIEDAGVDLAIAALVLHHVPSPPDAVAELARIVRPGGRVLLIEQMAHRCEAFHDLMQDRWWGFEPDELGRMLKRAGFDNVRARALTTTRSTEKAPAEVPGLFTLTGFRMK